MKFWFIVASHEKANIKQKSASGGGRENLSLILGPTLFGGDFRTATVILRLVKGEAAVQCNFSTADRVCLASAQPNP